MISIVAWAQEPGILLKAARIPDRMKQRLATLAGRNGRGGIVLREGERVI